MKSPKELSVDKKILSLLEGDSLRLAEILLHDEEIHAMQEYCNSVSIKRLGFNDHGPVHMRTVSLNAIIMMRLLREAGIKTSLEDEETGNWDESLCAVILAAFLHDLGMSIGRQDHELHSAVLAQPIVNRVLEAIFPHQLTKRVVIRSLAIEGIVGHMATRRIHSLEAGLILVADGCDMEKGRARIPLFLNTEPRQGDIHKYSANSIESVSIGAGAEKPIKIVIEMSSDVGFFQVEEVLLPKIEMSPAKTYLELYAGITPEQMKRYL
jgi:metal-dependent HD superfamily phosphatase/phosphodiesterase